MLIRVFSVVNNDNRRNQEAMKTKDQQKYDLAITELINENRRLSHKNPSKAPQILLIVVLIVVLAYLLKIIPEWFINKTFEATDATIKATQEIAEAMIPKEAFMNIKSSYGINADHCLGTSKTVNDFCSCVSNNSPSQGVQLKVGTDGVGKLIENGGKLKTTGCFPVQQGMGCFVYTYIQLNMSHTVVSGNSCFLKNFPVIKAPPNLFKTSR